jgi:hypothetical protein
MLMVGWAGSASATFSGPYDPANWTLTTNGGDGSVNELSESLLSDVISKTRLVSPTLGPTRLC